LKKGVYRRVSVSSKNSKLRLDKNVSTTQLVKVNTLQQINKPTKRAMKVTLLTSLGLATLGSLSLQGALLIDQNFDSLSGWTDTTGGNWSVGGNLTYAGWGSSGNAASELTGGTGQYLQNASILGSSTIDEGTTYWGGFLMNVSSPSTANRYFGFYDVANNPNRLVIKTTGSNQILMGTRDSGDDGNDGNLTTGSAIAMGTGSTNLLMFRIDALQGNDNLYAWWNPDLSLGEPSIASATWSSVGIDNFATTGNMSGFRFNSSNGQQVTFDELRLGDSFAAVVGSGIAPVPEPSTYALMAGLATLGLVLIRRRKKA
jgi:hypothetical protein